MHSLQGLGFWDCHLQHFQHIQPSCNGNTNKREDVHTHTPPLPPHKRTQLSPWKLCSEYRPRPPSPRSYALLRLFSSVGLRQLAHPSLFTPQ